MDALSNFISDNESSGAIYNSLLSDLEALAVHHDTPIAAHHALAIADAAAKAAQADVLTINWVVHRVAPIFASA